MVRTAINLYSVRELDESLPDILARVADAGYDGVQFSSGLRDSTPEEVAETLAETGLAVTGAHVGIDVLETDLEGTIETYSTVGCESVVVPWLDASRFASLATIEDTANRLSALGERLAAHDFGLHYHNHDHEFVELDDHDRSGFELLIDATPRIEFELDVGWAATAGYDPAELLYHIGDRGSLVHMKDMDTSTGTFSEIGEGDVDMQACADAARQIGAEWLIYEHDDPDDPAASIDRGAEYLDVL